MNEQRRKDDALDQIEALKRDLSPRDPMAHPAVGSGKKGDRINYPDGSVREVDEHGKIGEAVKEIVHRQTQELYKSMKEAHVYAIDDPIYMAAEESKRKARSDRMKATWAAQKPAAVDVELP